MTQAAINAFTNAANTTISYSPVNMVNNLGNGPVQIKNEIVVGKGLSRLYKALKDFAGHTTGRPDAAVACLPETRKSARAKIDEWKCGQVDRTARSESMWLTGPAGCGKTSVAESTRLAFREEGLLVVDCFFSYSIGRTNAKYLCLTLAYQLATSTISKAVLGPLIETVVTNDRSVVDASVDIQFKRLILEPIEKAGTAIPTVFIIVDGLDECGTVENHRELWQTEILRLFQDATSGASSLPIRFLVSSRPEIWIQHTLISPSAPHIFMVSLNQNEEADTDIRFFYVTEFNQIRNQPEFQNTLFPSESATTWPSNDIIDILVDNASGQFVYAKTVTRFLSEPYHPQSPIQRLTSLLHRNNTAHTIPRQFEELDNLYRLILSFSGHHQTFDILGSIDAAAVYEFQFSQYMRDWFSILEVLWELGQGTAYNLLRHSHSVVLVPSDLTSTRETMPPEVYGEMLQDENQFPRFYHKSFTDFLHDPRRAGEFHVDLQDIHHKLAIACLQVLQNVACCPRTRLHAVTWKCAYCSWDGHCRRGGSNGSASVLETLDSFQFTSHYFVYRKIAGRPWKAWRKMPLLRLIEKRDGNVKEVLKNIHDLLQSIDIHGAYWYHALPMWEWAKTQTMIESSTFLKLRFKLWYLQRMANEVGYIC